MTNASHTVTRDEARAVRDEKGKKYAWCALRRDVYGRVDAAWGVGLERRARDETHGQARRTRRRGGERGE